MRNAAEKQTRTLSNLQPSTVLAEIMERRLYTMFLAYGSLATSSAISTGMEMVNGAVADLSLL